jgi:hypothetical protein
MFISAVISAPERKIVLTAEKGQKIELRFLERWAWFVKLLAFIAKRMRELPSGKVLWYDIEAEIERLRNARVSLTIKPNTTGPRLAASFNRFWAVHIHGEKRKYFTLLPGNIDKKAVTKPFFGVEHSNLLACYWLNIPPKQIDVVSEEGIMMSAQVAVSTASRAITHSGKPAPSAEGEKGTVGENSVAANLDKILELLDEENIAKAVSIKHDETRERYSLAKATVVNYAEFLTEIAKYYAYHFKKTIANADLPVEIASQNALEIVQQAYASQGGLEAAYRNANVGTGGGLRTVIDSIYEALKREQEEKYVNHVLTTQVNPLDWNERVALMNQYLTKFGKYLPTGTKARSAEQIANNYGELIKLHTKVVGTIRSRLRL